MQMTVETEAFASAGGPGLNFSSFATDLGDTFAWGGIQKVMVDGTEVTDFSALSADTGFDYRYAYVEPGSGAVPEPATWALMLTGFGLGGTMLRSRRVPRQQIA
ncbi:MAG: PEP-CTERM sorting domain-containing protein [Phenylobacterium sp.]|nr:PEP-CTERM sorting domain-containing protein [Phenylobacterium sp.]